MENEGFNIQKNTDYNLHRRYTRKSYNAQRSYYICLQIAHMISQLVEKSREIVSLKKDHPKLTLKAIPEHVISYLKMIDINICDFNTSDKRFQIRLC